MNQEEIHDTSQSTSDVKSDQRNPSKKKVKFPSDENIVSQVFIPEKKCYDNCSSTALIEHYLSGCFENDVKPNEFLLEQLKGIDTSICDERYNKISLKGIKITSAHIEAIEEIFKRVQFRQVDFEDCNLDDSCAGALFDMLKYYESCYELVITANFDPPNQRSGWYRCVQFLRKSKTLTSLTLLRSNVSREFFVGINFIGINLNKLSLIDCNLGYDVKTVGSLVKILKNIFMIGSFKSNKTFLENQNNCRKAMLGKFSSQIALSQKFQQKYSQKEWKFSLDLQSNRLGASVVEQIAPLLTHYLLEADLDLMGKHDERVYQIFRGNGYLQELNLANNQLRDAGLQLLVEELSYNLNKIINRTLVSLVKVFQADIVQSFDDLLAKVKSLSKSELLQRACVKRVYAIERLDLSRNQITSTSIPALGTWLRQSTTVYSAFPHFIHCYSGLTHLNLSNNPGIGDRGVEILCNHLTFNKTLCYLGLRSCSFSFPGVYAIASYLSETTNLESLDIRDNVIRLSSLMALAKTLRVNQSLKVLLLGSTFQSNNNPDQMVDEEDNSELHEHFHKEINSYIQRNCELKEEIMTDENEEDSDQIPYEGAVFENQYAAEE